MRKAFLSISLCLAAVIVSCGCKEEEKKRNDNQEQTATVVCAQPAEYTSIDTLSYIIGMDIANSIEKNMIPMFKIDYNVMISALILK